MRPARDQGSAGRRARVPARQPLLRHRPAQRLCLVAVRQYAAGLGAGSRRSAISSTTTSSSTTRTPTRSRTAHGGYSDRTGVCRDFAHLAITLCRCMNIPARYCTGYLGDIGVPPVPDPMDFSAWFEAYLSGRWYTFDARHNQPRDRPGPDGHRPRRDRRRPVDQFRAIAARRISRSSPTRSRRRPTPRRTGRPPRDAGDLLLTTHDPYSMDVCPTRRAQPCSVS